ncbi:MAG: bestrophin [Proteobacteria bacterium]|nr:bestrophin [Pseudomonadota bacterium]
MIVRPRPGIFGLLFILRGSILSTISLSLVCILLVSSGIAWWGHAAPDTFDRLSPAPFTLLGLALSIFLGFRNNTCYERWWEARQLWGRLLAETRAFARDSLSLLPKDGAAGRRIVRRSVAFAHALRGQLRGEAGQSARDWLTAEDWERVARSSGRPDAILRLQADELAAALGRGEITDNLYRLFSDRLLAMTDIQAACERLRSTPTPFAYTLLLHRTAWLFCLLVPFGLVANLGFMTPVVTVILAYAFFGLDALGQELEEPFGRTVNAVPLDALVRSIEIAALEAGGETQLPPPLLPQDYVLL